MGSWQWGCFDLLGSGEGLLLPLEFLLLSSGGGCGRVWVGLGAQQWRRGARETTGQEGPLS